MNAYDRKYMEYDNDYEYDITKWIREDYTLDESYGFDESDERQWLQEEDVLYPYPEEDSA